LFLDSRPGAARSLKAQSQVGGRDNFRCDGARKLYPAAVRKKKEAPPPPPFENRHQSNASRLGRWAEPGKGLGHRDDGAGARGAYPLCRAPLPLRGPLSSARVHRNLHAAGFPRSLAFGVIPALWCMLCSEKKKKNTGWRSCRRADVLRGNLQAQDVASTSACPNTISATRSAELSRSTGSNARLLTKQQARRRRLGRHSRLPGPLVVQLSR